MAAEYRVARRKKPTGSAVSHDSLKPSLKCIQTRKNTVEPMFVNEVRGPGKAGFCLGFLAELEEQPRVQKPPCGNSYFVPTLVISKNIWCDRHCFLRTALP